MSNAKRYFDIDREQKTFVFTHKNFQELYNENSEVYKAFKATLALGCYDGYIPVEKERTIKVDRNTAAQGWTEKGIIHWIELNNSSYLPIWKAMKEVTNIQGNAFPFMVKKNLFLYDNPAARKLCGIKEDENNPYKLQPSAAALNSLVQKQLEKAKEQEAATDKAKKPVTK